MVLESIQHLFIQCSFARACWAAIGISLPRINCRKRVISMLKRHISQPFFMEVIILMMWSIANIRNDWIFSNKDPTVEGCKRRFINDFRLLLHRAKRKYFPTIELWLDDLAQPP
jgi:hypothetical protein